MKDCVSTSIPLPRRPMAQSAPCYLKTDTSFPNAYLDAVGGASLRCTISENFLASFFEFLCVIGMKAILVSLLVAFASQLPAAEVAYAIVHGPKAAFNISAPAGWVIDNEAGASDGLPCVLFQKGKSWSSADPLMYAKIASASHENAEDFAKKAISESKKDRGDFQVKRVESGKTKGGEAYFINEYAPNADYPRMERVAYVQLPNAVAYIVYSGDNDKAFRSQQSALKQLVSSLTAMTVKKD